MPATPQKFRIEKEHLSFRERLGDNEYQNRILEQLRRDGANLHDLVNMALSEPEWLVDGWLVDDMGLLLTGDPKSYKSTMAFDLAMSLAYAEPFLGLFEVRSGPQPVVYLHEENTAKDVRRHGLELLHRMGFGHINTVSEKGKYGQRKENRIWTQADKDIPEGVVSLVRTRSGFKVDEDALADLKDVVLREGIKWIFLDPLYKIQTQGTGLNDDKAIAHITTSLDALAEETHSNIVLIHHNNKSKGAAGGHKIMGSNLIHGWAPQLWQLQRDDDLLIKGSTVRKVTVRPDFRSLAPHWSEKTMLYEDWATWKEAGSRLPGERRKSGRPQSPLQQDFGDRYINGEFEGMSQAAIAAELGVAQKSVSNWIKTIGDEPDTL